MKGLLSAGAYSLTSVMAQGLVRLLYSLLIARFMSPGSLSDVNTLISIGMFASLLWPASVATAATKFIARARGAGDSALINSTTHYLRKRALLGSLILAAMAAGYTFTFEYPGDVLPALFTFLVVMGFGLSAFVRGVLFASDRRSRAAFLDVTALIIAIAGLILVIRFGQRDLLLLPLVVGYSFVIIAGWPRTGRHLQLPLPQSEIKAFISWGVAGVVATGGFLQLTMVIAHAVGTQATSDLYAAALSLATPASMLTSVLSLILFPSISRAVGSKNHDLARRQTDWAMRALTVVLLAAFGSLVLLAPILLRIIYGTRFGSGSPILAILLAASLIGALAGPAADSLSSQTSKGVRRVAELRLLGFAIGLGACWLLVPTLGIMGVAVSYLVGMIVVGFGPIGLAWFSYRLKWGVLGLRFCFGAAVVVVFAAVQSVREPNVLLSIVLVCIFILVCFALFYNEVRQLLKLRISQ